MGRTESETKPKSWSETNKIRKEERKKWQEQKLIKRLAKQALEQTQQTTTVVTEKKPQISTISIAVPGSILENAQCSELQTLLAGQIARAACIFQVDEVIVFDDYSDEASAKKTTLEDNYGVKTMRKCCIQLGRILQFLECPQYLRKHFFPIHNDLKFAGLLNPLNAPHHLTKDELFIFREGVVQNKPVKHSRGEAIVDVGLNKDVYIDKSLTPGLRCTVKLQPDKETPKRMYGSIVSSSEPRRETGVYWGYTVRLASSLSKVLSQCPYKEGYDLTVGTSDKGKNIDEFESPPFLHLLVVFGGVKGLEFALETDDTLNINEPELLFDEYLNTLPHQGSKTIRTEEAVLVTLAALRPKLRPKAAPAVFEPERILYKSIVEGPKEKPPIPQDGP